jgi:hypothetical protein
VQLGITKSNGVPTTLFSTREARWLGAQIAQQPEQPRVLLISVPYALRAGDAKTVEGLSPSVFVLAPPPTRSGAAISDCYSSQRGRPCDGSAARESGRIRLRNGSRGGCRRWLPPLA